MVQALKVYRPDEVLNQLQPADLASYNLQFLAQGDSWFSLGAIPSWTTTNLLTSMSTTSMAACAINFAYPGRTLRLLADTTWEPTFLSFLCGHNSRRWAGVLLSGGGNDLIAALLQPPGQDARNRVLATSGEWGTQPGMDKYISNVGWTVFGEHLGDALKVFLDHRDQGENKGIPVVWHTYDRAAPRNSPAGPNAGPWLYKALTDYGIPKSDWPALSAHLFDKLKTLIVDLAAAVPDQSVTVVDTQGTLVPAAITDDKASADWENEIHPTQGGYDKLAAKWTPALDKFAQGIQLTARGG